MLCFWSKRSFEDNFLDWKVIPLFLIGKHLGKNSKFHNIPKEFYNNILNKIKWMY